MDICWHRSGGKLRVSDAGTDVFAFAMSLIDRVYVSDFSQFSRVHVSDFLRFSFRNDPGTVFDRIIDYVRGILKEDPELFDLIYSMLAKNPADRPSLDEVIPVLQKKFLDSNCD